MEPVSFSIDVKLGLKEVVADVPDRRGGFVICVPPNLLVRELCVDCPEISPVECVGFSLSYLLRYVMRS